VEVYSWAMIVLQVELYQNETKRLSHILNCDVLGRMLPVLALVVPTVMYGLFKYWFSIMVRGVANRIMHITHRHGQEKQVRYHVIYSVCTQATVLNPRH
jgi:hypothetical protein